LAVPDYQTFMLPLLEILGDGEVHALHECIDQLAVRFNLTPEDRREVLPSGAQPKLSNRVSWARTYMAKAGLLEKVGRGKIRITERGKDLLQRSPERIDSRLLEDYSEFREFKKRPDPTSFDHPSGPRADEEKTSPEEQLEESYARLRDTVARDLLDRVKKCSPGFFERIVVDLLVAMGYGGSRKDAAEALGGRGDGGVDGRIKEDKLGLDAVYVQAKRWDSPVGPAVVRDFAGSLEGQKARKGVLITTSTFSPEVEKYVERIEKRIVLIGGTKLAQLMMDHGVGVSEQASYKVVKIDEDYFEE